MNLWSSVDDLIGRLGADGSCEHGLGPLAARRAHLLGEPLPERLAREERAAMSSNLVASTLLARARAAYEGPLVLLKGTELSRLYPDRARRFGDLDLLPGDAEQAQEALLAAGFRLQDRDWPPEGYDDIKRPHYHLHPLEWPGLALRIELHKHVKWPEGILPPSNDEIFAAAVPAAVGIAGLMAPDPTQHAVILASHAWGEIPMRRLRQLVDVMAFVQNRDREPFERLAMGWGFRPGWDTTLAVADWLFAGATKPLAVRTWARYLEGLREPTVVEMHFQEWASPFWMVPPRRAVRLSAAAVTRDVRPVIGQTWGDKLAQMLRALRHPLSPKSEHDRRSGRGAWRPGKGPH
jgi:hypothetical protein